MGALVHVYTDGLIRPNHGGTEMGQGLFVKVAQIGAGLPGRYRSYPAVRHLDRRSASTPSPTAASTGSDFVGWAAYEAASTIKQRMIAFAAEHFSTSESEITFDDGNVRIASQLRGDRQQPTLTFGEPVTGCAGSAACRSRPPVITRRPRSSQMARCAAIHSSTSYGAALAEVAIDTLTGESRVLRTDLVQDCGASLNPVIDHGHARWLRPPRLNSSWNHDPFSGGI